MHMQDEILPMFIIPGYQAALLPTAKLNESNLISVDLQNLGEWDSLVPARPHLHNLRVLPAAAAPPLLRSCRRLFLSGFARLGRGYLDHFTG